MKSNEKSTACPITDVRIVKKDDKFDEILAILDPVNKLNYVKVDPPADTDASWVLLYSKDYDSPPIRNFEF